MDRPALVSRHFVRMMRCVRTAAITVIAASACQLLPPPRAVVAVHAPGDAARHAVLVMPTECVSGEPTLCSLSTYLQGLGAAPVAASPVMGVDELVDPILHFDLELAGYTLADARTLRLTTVDRTDSTEQADARGQTTPTGQATRIEEGPTVASLAPGDRLAAARSLGLTGALRSTLTIAPDRASFSAQLRFELAVELDGLPDGVPLWTVRCSEPLEDVERTTRLLASCVGDGVLAWRAPDAVIGRTP
jgi:hypothetical protein